MLLSFGFVYFVLDHDCTLHSQRGFIYNLEMTICFYYTLGREKMKFEENTSATLLILDNYEQRLSYFKNYENR